MTFWRGLVLGFGMLALAACANGNAFSEVKALNQAQATGSPFTQALAAGYRDLANMNLNKLMDYPDALHFARKGLAAASGTVALPEPISDWNLTPENMQELSAARGRLIVAYDLGARDAAPEQAATAQVKFDCWIEEQEQNHDQNGASPGCKNEFLDAMKMLDGMLKAPPPAAAAFPPPVEPAPVPAAAPPMKTENAVYLVFFDFDSSKIGSGGDNVLDAVAQEVKGRDLKAIQVIGHTDRAGTRGYNYKLSMRRAKAVREALAARGIDVKMIKISGRGEDQPMVPTPDGVREPANRRAQISFE